MRVGAKGTNKGNVLYFVRPLATFSTTLFSRIISELLVEIVCRRYSFGRLAPYFDRALRRLLTPAVSSAPGIT